METDNRAQIAARLHAEIHFAETKVERLNNELEAMLRDFTADETAEYVDRTAAQVNHWQSLKKSS